MIAAVLDKKIFIIGYRNFDNLISMVKLFSRRYFNIINTYSLGDSRKPDICSRPGIGKYRQNTGNQRAEFSQLNHR